MKIWRKKVVSSGLSFIKRGEIETKKATDTEEDHDVVEVEAWLDGGEVKAPETNETTGMIKKQT